MDDGAVRAELKEARADPVARPCFTRRRTSGRRALRPRLHRIDSHRAERIDRGVNEKNPKAVGNVPGKRCPDEGVS